MNRYVKDSGLSRSSLQEVGIEGVLMTISPLPIMLTTITTGTDFSALRYLYLGSWGLNSSSAWYCIIALLASIFSFLSAFLILRRPIIGQICAATALAGTTSVAMPYLITNPFAAFIGAVALISASFYLIDLRVKIRHDKKSTSQKRSLQRVHYAVMTIPIIVILRLIIDTTPAGEHLLDGALTASATIVQLILLHCALKQDKIAVSTLWSLFSVVMVAALATVFYREANVPVAVLIVALLTIFILPRSTAITNRYGQWWEMFLNHPARMMLTTFLGLSTLGTIMLILPISATKSAINIVDAAFTSVSAVCVTGLIVLDTPNDFTLTGQIFILVLIQLGGLGIMSITTVGMHAMGRRLTLRHERLLTNMTDTDHKDLILSLVTILKFTFIAEGVGAVILTALFYRTGDGFGQAIWRGGFTAVSAFCNAGFALQSDNLIPYQRAPMVLHTVATLIILGGIAPATTLLIPRWITGKTIPVAPYIALVTTSVLLISGTLFFLVFEWNDLLSNLSVTDKIHNAWFQSATLRTAGFNSVDISAISSPTFLLMICLMFIGGSPGGTAGGVKTTTVGILIMTFWTNITNHKSVVILNRRVQSRIIHRAITIVTSGVLTWLVMVLMAEVTQQIPASDIIFEVTSAIGTVGLSTGATTHLDEIGKIIIMITMFVGRIGPITIFMLLSGERNDNPSRYQNAKISLT